MRHKIRKILCLCLITAMIGGILTESDYALFARAEENTEGAVPEAAETDIPAADAGTENDDAAAADDTVAGDDSTTPDTPAADDTVTGDDSITPDTPAADDTAGSDDSLTEDASGEILVPEEQELLEEEEPASLEDTSDVEQIQIKENKVSYVSGASRQEDGTLVWTPSESAAGHAFVYEVVYRISNVESFAPGTVHITLPLHILKDREGNWADSFECPYPTASKVTEGDIPEFTYVIDEEANTVTLTNYKKVTVGQAGFIEISYTTTKSTLDYADMVSSEAPSSVMEITNEDGTPLEEEVKSMSEAAEAVSINTHVEISWTKKNRPTFYSTWQDSWGTAVKPEEDEKYYYLIWMVESYVGDNTSPYDLTLTDNFEDQDVGGQVVGYRFTGQSEFQVENHAENLRGSRYRYDYILTRHEKDKASDKADVEGFYILQNQVTATVSPTDKVDPDTSASSSADWRYDRPSYEPPGGHFDSWKNGLYNGGSTVYSSSDISSYQLGQFMEEKTDRINGLNYCTWSVAYPYPWTLEEGATGTQEDAENGEYGKKKVKYQFTDDTFALEGQSLTDDDYEITDVSLTVSMRDAEYNSEKLAFQEKAIEEYQEEDNVTLQVRTGENDWKNAAVYDMASGSFKDADNSLVTAVSGRTLTFAAGVKGLRLTCSNAYYYTYFSMTPVISLLATTHTKGIIGEKDLVSLTNTSDYQVSQGEDTIFSQQKSGTDHIRKVTPRSDLRKEVTATRNDKKKRRYLVTWRIRQSESYQDDGTHYIGQQSGIFYDLLPAGAGLDRSSIVVQAGSTTLNTGAYTVETTENYHDTGRMLLKVSVSEQTDTTYQMSYQTVHAYNAIQDFGKNLLNSAAYETGNDDITGGSSDDGGQITEKELLAGLDPDHPGDKFLYAECRHNITILMYGNIGLLKQVKTEKDADYSYETTVGQGGAYTYQLRLANDKATRAKNLIFFDSLEYFYREDTDTPTITSDWYGSLTGIDLSGLTAKGIQPVVYLSDEKGLNINRHHDLTEKKADGTPLWLEYSVFLESHTLADAHAVAIDASRKKDSSAFILEEGKSLVVTLHMKAPETDSSGVTDPITYNNIYLEETVLSENDEVGQEKFIHQDYTRIHYRITGDLQLRKVDATDSTAPVKGATYLLRGTSDYGTVYEISVTTGRDGSLLYEGIEKGTYELLETSCTDDWLLDTEVYRVTVDSQGKVTVAGLANAGEEENPVWLLKDSPRIHADLQICKKDSISLDLVNGAEFLLTGTSDYGTDVLLHATSEGTDASGNARGIISFQNLELGTYKLTEVAAPDGYILDKTVWTVKVDERGAAVLKDESGKEVSKDGSNYYYEISNEPLHKVTFLKTSSYGTGVTLEGAAFTLTGVSDYGTNVEKTAASNENGLVEITGLEPGTYLLRETKAPENYELNTTVYPVTVKSDGTFTIEGLEQIELGGTAASLYNFKDDPTGGIVKIIKVWKDDGPDDKDRPDKLDIAISTTKPSKDTRGYTLTFDANGGSFTDGSTENDLVYTSGSTTPIEGTYRIPTSDDGTFKGWYTAKTGGTKFEDIANNGTLTTALTADTTLYAQYKPAMKYAVAIYGIGVDDIVVDDAGNTEKGGLTFGPAVGASYVKTSKPAHTPSSDKTKLGNDHRCVHNDSWTEIIAWNKKDPYVYEECIAEGCTKSVPLTENGTTTILNPDFDASTETGDGPSVLYSELYVKKDGNTSHENLRWRPNDPNSGDYGSNQGGWGATRIRAMLNGADELTDTKQNGGNYSSHANGDINKNANIYTAENCLLATFPQELQAAIGKRAVKYDSVYSQKTEANRKTSADKLWLFSPNELGDTSSMSYACHPLEGNVYDKFAGSQAISTSRLAGYTTGGVSSWWLRSSGIYSSYVLLVSNGGGIYGNHAFSIAGVAPGFTLER